VVFGKARPAFLGIGHMKTPLLNPNNCCPAFVITTETHRAAGRNVLRAKRHVFDCRGLLFGITALVVLTHLVIDGAGGVLCYQLVIAILPIVQFQVFEFHGVEVCSVRSMGEAVARMAVRVENVKQFFDFFEKFLDVLGVHGLRFVLEVVNDDEAFQQGVVGLAAKGRGHRSGFFVDDSCAEQECSSCPVHPNIVWIHKRTCSNRHVYGGKDDV
jgi:hypothetical protein